MIDALQKGATSLRKLLSTSRAGVLRGGRTTLSRLPPPSREFLSAFLLPRVQIPAACPNNILVRVSSLCLSRACLGKMIIYI
eukprot:COSAG06_NODE_1376_length_9648_cov_67.818096_8_plen_82_part_00